MFEGHSSDTDEDGEQEASRFSIANLGLVPRDVLCCRSNHHNGHTDCRQSCRQRPHSDQPERLPVDLRSRAGRCRWRCTRDVGGDVSRRDRKAAFEVRADRHVNAQNDRSEMDQRLIKGDAIVWPPRAGGGQGHEAEPGERARGADVPWVGDHEAASGMELVERLAAIGISGHRRTHGPLLP